MSDADEYRNIPECGSCSAGGGGGNQSDSGCTDELTSVKSKEFSFSKSAIADLPSTAVQSIHIENDVPVEFDDDVFVWRDFSPSGTKLPVKHRFKRQQFVEQQMKANVKAKQQQQKQQSQQQQQQQQKQQAALSSSIAKLLSNTRIPASIRAKLTVPKETISLTSIKSTNGGLGGKSLNNNRNKSVPKIISQSKSRLKSRARNNSRADSKTRLKQKGATTTSATNIGKESKRK